MRSVCLVRWGIKRRTLPFSDLEGFDCLDEAILAFELVALILDCEESVTVLVEAENLWKELLCSG